LLVVGFLHSRESLSELSYTEEFPENHAAEVVSTEAVAFMGDRPREICSGHGERQNFTMRMQMHRFTRLSNGFSKKRKNHWAARFLWFAFYNFCRFYSKLRVTPTMEAGVADHIWTVRKLLESRVYSAGVPPRLRQRVK
jgi:hypothetical protein